HRRAMVWCRGVPTLERDTNDTTSTSTRRGAPGARRQRRYTSSPMVGALPLSPGPEHIESLLVSPAGPVHDIPLRPRRRVQVVELRHLGIELARRFRGLLHLGGRHLLQGEA